LATITSIVAKIGCTPETLRRWVRQQETDACQSPGLASAEQERMNALERENRELRKANEILRLASAFSPRWNSTAASSRKCVHRRASPCLRRRADLPRHAGRAVGLMASHGAHA